MKLADLLDSIYVKSVSGSLDVEVTGVHFDSRQVEPGGVFCALIGQGVDGNSYIDSAIERGAVAIISSLPNPAEFMATWIEVGNAREAMGAASSNFYSHPSLEMPVVGITGTNGKTTTAYLVHHLMQTILRRAGMLGTIQYSTGDEIVDAPHTTPESPELQRLLREMRDNDCRGAVMEVSSHGLIQHRSTGVAFDVGIFTNLSQDHLDFHGGMDNYFAAKRLLFERMDCDSRKKGVAVINGDDSWGDRLQKDYFGHLTTLTFGRSVGCDFRASDLRADFDGTQFKLSFKERSFLVRIPLIGDFNVYNAVAAIASAYGIGLNLREIIKEIAQTPQVPGRLEAVGGRQIDYRVFVDYAHTPDALKNVLATLKGLEPERVITVFGCGGDRDVTKRSLMAIAAEQGGDLCILTSDNPRTEDPVRILEDAEKGFQRRDYEVIEDRSEAIRKAIQLAGPRDIVLIAGKGHETCQEINGVRHDFDDRRIAAQWIREKAEGGS